MSKDVTVKELRDVLNELIEQGCADYEVIVSYDSGYAGTSIKDEPPKINKDSMIEYCSVKFKGY